MFLSGSVNRVSGTFERAFKGQEKERTVWKNFEPIKCSKKE